MKNEGLRMIYEWRIKVEGQNMDGGLRLKDRIWMEDEG